MPKLFISAGGGGGGGGGSSTTSGLTYTVVSLSGNTTAQNGRAYMVNTGAARTITLPAASSGLWFKVKDVSGTASSNNITIARAGSESIEGVASNKTLQTDFGAWEFICDGTSWWLT